MPAEFGIIINKIDKNKMNVLSLLTFWNICLGSGEGLLDDEGFAATHLVPRDHTEVVGGILFQATDLNGGLARGHDLLPGLLPNLLPLNDVLLNLGPAVGLRHLPGELQGVLRLPLYSSWSTGRRGFI